MSEILPSFELRLLNLGPPSMQSTEAPLENKYIFEQSIIMIVLTFLQTTQEMGNLEFSNQS